MRRTKNPELRAALAWSEPPAVALLAASAIIMSVVLLSRIPAQANGAEFVRGSGWRIWRGVASTGVADWIVTGLYGFVGLASAVRQTQTRLLVLVAMSFGFLCEVAMLFSVFGVLKGGQRFGVPIQGWDMLIDALMVVGSVAALPWVLRLWLLAPKLKELSDAVDHSSSHPLPMSQPVHLLLDTWREIERSLLAMALILIPATLNTGAIRLAVVPKYISPSDFPESTVILYGAIFVVLIAWTVVPLIGVWRSAALRLVDALNPLPESGCPSRELLDSRIGLETMLGVNTGLLRSPVTLLGIFAPLATAALTTLVPGAR